MGKGILVGIISGMWIYAIIKTHDELSSGGDNDILKVAIFTGVVNGFFYAAAAGAFDS